MNGMIRSRTMKKALIAPKQRARRDAGDERRPRRSHARVAHQEPGDQRREVHDRAHRKVDPRRQQHEGHADRGDADEARLLDDVGEVARAPESPASAARSRRRTARNIIARRVAQQRARRLRVAVMPPSRLPPERGARGCASRVEVAARRSSPTISPRLITRMRSHMPISSSSSEEMNRMPRPVGREPVGDARRSRTWRRRRRRASARRG